MADLEDEPDILLPCAICARTFKPESLAKHVKVCEKTAAKKRKPFDSAKQRIQGTELAEFLPKQETIVISTTTGGNNNKENNNVRNHKRNNNTSNDEKPKGTWKQTHHEFLRTIRAARGDCEDDVSPTSKQQCSPAAVTSGAPTRANEKGTCPTCNRQFGIKAYDRHVEWCRERSTRLPVSPASNVAKERLEARMKYRAPGLKSRRPTNREKYSPTSATSLSGFNLGKSQSAKVKESVSAPNFSKCTEQVPLIKQRPAVVRRLPGLGRDQPTSSGPMKAKPMDDTDNRQMEDCESCISINSCPTPLAPPHKSSSKSSSNSKQKRNNNEDLENYSRRGSSTFSTPRVTTRDIMKLTDGAVDDNGMIVRNYRLSEDDSSSILEEINKINDQCIDTSVASRKGDVCDENTNEDYSWPPRPGTFNADQKKPSTGDDNNNNEQDILNSTYTKGSDDRKEESRLLFQEALKSENLLFDFSGTNDKINDNVEIITVNCDLFSDKRDNNNGVSAGEQVTTAEEEAEKMSFTDHCTQTPASEDEDVIVINRKFGRKYSTKLLSIEEIRTFVIGKSRSKFDPPKTKTSDQQKSKKPKEKNKNLESIYELPSDFTNCEDQFSEDSSMCPSEIIKLKRPNSVEMRMRRNIETMDCSTDEFVSSKETMINYNNKQQQAPPSFCHREATMNCNEATVEETLPEVKLDRRNRKSRKPTVRCHSSTRKDCEGLTLPPINSTKDSGLSKDYDPLLMAERQLNDLFSDTSDLSSTDSLLFRQKNEINKLSNYPLSSAFSKYPDTPKPQLKSRGTSLIAPPNEFDDLISDFSSDSTETNSISRELFMDDCKTTRPTDSNNKRSVLGRRVIIDKSKALGQEMLVTEDRSKVDGKTTTAKSAPMLIKPMVNRSHSVRASSAPRIPFESKKTFHGSSLKKTEPSKGSSVSLNNKNNGNNNNNNNNNYMAGSNLSLTSIISSEADVKRSNSMFDELLSSFEDDVVVVTSNYPFHKSNDPMSSPVQSRQRNNGQTSDEELSSPDSYKRHDHGKLSADSAYSSLNRKYSSHGQSANHVGGQREDSLMKHAGDADYKHKMSKYCHECGSKFPTTAKFCCECGVKRLAV